MTTVDPYGTSGTGSGGYTVRPLGTGTKPSYLGGGTYPLIPDEDQVPTPTGALPTRPGYVNGDQANLLPTNAQDIATLQQSLIQAGYITQSQLNQMVFGSPDPITTTAFAKLLATANYTGTTWKDALATRLAQAAQMAPEVKKPDKIPPLTIQVSNPDDIKAILQKTARDALGQYMPDDQANAFVAQIQGQQSTAQSQQYYQQYTPTPGDPTTGSYGPGGTTVSAPTSEGVAAEALTAAKTSDPAQYMATQFGADVQSKLSSLRSTGYFS